MQNFLSISKDNTISSIAIGKFDGLHLGHQKLLSMLADFATFAMKDCAAIVIDTHSSEYLTSPDDRYERLSRSVGNVFVLDLDSVRELSGGEFVGLLKNLLPNLRHIVVGYDFAFGKNRAFGAEDLQRLFANSVDCANATNADSKTAMKKQSILANATNPAGLPKITIIPKVSHNEIPLHSSVIKDLIAHGDIAIANAMLGWHYKLKCKITKGQGIGSKELFPTINALTEGYVLPSNGVYATRTNGANSVSFIGQRLSTDGSFAIESHILGDFAKSSLVKDRDYKEGIIHIEFIQKLRENRHFETLDLLKCQIQKDISNAKTIFDRGGLAGF